MVKNYKYEKTQENGDATSNYRLVGEFPVCFRDFFTWILENEHSFRVTFRSLNECFGGWLGNKLVAHKDRDNDKWYWENREPENWFDIIADLNVISVKANGGWGQMIYYCEFEIEEPLEKEQ